MSQQNPFDHRFVAKMLLKTHMPHAENKRKCRSFIRKMARHIETAWEVGHKDGLDGKPLIPLGDLPQNKDSPMGREMAHKAYVAYQNGYKAGNAERKEVN